MKQPIFKCNRTIESAKTNALDRVKKHNDLLHLITSKGFDVINENVENIFSNPKEYVLNQLTNGTGVVINGIKVNVEKAFDLLEIPIEIIEIVNDLERTSNITISKNYTIENGSIVLTQHEIDRIEESATVFVETKEQLEVWDKLNEVANTLNTVSKSLNLKNDLKLISQCFGFNSMGNNPHDIFKTDPNIVKHLK